MTERKQRKGRSLACNITKKEAKVRRLMPSDLCAVQDFPADEFRKRTSTTPKSPKTEGIVEVLWIIGKWERRLP